MLTDFSPQRAAWTICLVMFTAIAGAWIFEAYGYLPCELCLKQRFAYYAIVPLAFLLAAMKPSWIRAGLWLAALILLASMVFGIYHAGVEWKFWPGPGECTGGTGMGGGLPDLTKPFVRCDEPALRIFGISLAGYNALISAAMAFVAIRGATNR